MQRDGGQIGSSIQDPNAIHIALSFATIIPNVKNTSNAGSFSPQYF